MTVAVVREAPNQPMAYSIHIDAELATWGLGHPAVFFGRIVVLPPIRATSVSQDLAAETSRGMENKMVFIITSWFL